jgi:DNA polymerase III epsilon subunit-like protein
MKIISIDIETTGLDLEDCKMLEFSAVVEDTNDIKPIEECPSFTCIIENGGLLTGSPYAFNMNKKILEILAGQEKLKGKELEEYRLKHSIIKKEDLATSFYYFLQVHKIINPFNDENGGGLGTNWTDLCGEKHFVTCFTNKSKKVHINVLGKNFGTFDRIFIEKSPRWQQIFKIRKRIADPSILYTDWKNDETLPNFQTCMERADIDGEVSHTAYDDAKDTLTMLRRATKDYTVKLFDIEESQSSKNI